MQSCLEIISRFPPPPSLFYPSMNRVYYQHLRVNPVYQSYELFRDYFKVILNPYFLPGVDAVFLDSVFLFLFFTLYIDPTYHP